MKFGDLSTSPLDFGYDFHGLFFVVVGWVLGALNAFGIVFGFCLAFFVFFARLVNNFMLIIKK